MFICRNDDYYYDELYPKEKSHGAFEDYETGTFDIRQKGFAHSQTLESKEISNYLIQFNNNQDSKHRKHITESGNLVLRHVTREDKGSYVCRASNMVGSKSSEAAILSVHGEY